MYMWEIDFAALEEIDLADEHFWRNFNLPEVEFGLPEANEGEEHEINRDGPNEDYSSNGLSDFTWFEDYNDWDRQEFYISQCHMSPNSTYKMLQRENYMQYMAELFSNDD